MTFYNWNKTEACNPTQVFEPKTEEELKDILRKAKKTGRQVRVVGPARHTWGEISMSTAYVINMRYFTKLISVDKKKKTARVQAGHIIHKLFRTLAKHGLSVNNMGGIDAQTIAGVVSTGTHGSSLHHGTFSDDVLSLRVMLYDGRIIEVDKTHPHFPAFQVSLGSIGILLEVTLQCADLFYVRSKTEQSSLSCKELSPKKLLELLKKNYFFQVTIDADTQQMIFYNRQKIAAKSLSTFQKKLVLPIKSFFQEIREFVGIYSVEYIALRGIALFPKLTKKALTTGLKLAKENCTDLSYKALTIGRNDRQGVYVNKTFHDQEYAISIQDTQKALKEIFVITKDFPNIPLLLALRFVKGSKAWLSPSYGRDTCYIDVLLFAENFQKWSGFIERVEKALYPFGVRPHWGKHNFLNYKILKKHKLYPKLESFRKIKEFYDPQNTFGNPYLNQRLSPTQKHLK